MGIGVIGKSIPTATASSSLGAHVGAANEDLRENYSTNSPRRLLSTLPQHHQLSKMSVMISRKRQNAEPHSGPAKKIKILQDDDDSQSDSDGEETLNINTEYAKRFEHNKKRTELHQRTLRR